MWSRLWSVQGPAWKNLRGCRLGKRMDSGELVDFQGSSSLTSRMLHPQVQEAKQRWQGACMAEQAAPDYTQIPKGSIQWKQEQMTQEAYGGICL